MKKLLRQILPLKLRLQYHQIRKYFWLLNAEKFPKKKFIIFGSGRSGSTLLTSLLNSHPDIYCDGEILAKKSVPKVFFPQLFMSAVSKKAGKKNAKIYGCGLMSTQLRGQKNIELSDFLKTLNHKGWKIVHIRRSYIFDVVLSLLEAKEQKVWFMHKGESKKLEKIQPEPKQITQLIEHHIDLYSVEEEALKELPHFKVVYENDLLDNARHEAVVKKICDFLAIKPHKAKTNLTKKAKNKYSDRIENYTEVMEAIDKNNYKKILNPDLL